MHYKKLPFFILLFFVQIVFAQTQSPEQFLGYKIGTHFTPHWKVVDYFKYVAANNSATVKLQQYGQTNEGRPLIVVYVSTPKNISNLETIRTNNLRLANMTSEKVSATTNTPAIVWLSYNVHGNEASSSEASMLTLYALVDPANTQTKQWLQNTLVVIDPCLNPDGRDRYVNWYNSVVGKQYNPSLDAREHNEPWPGGRTNHYNFDLNRDWAWQTQLETQQRVKLFNEWLPQVHVDFHEQGVNAPYYFAPAAQPYHEVITKWERDFQNTIGRNHAKYFDAAGWLYFTKEVFDLLYPSYGDTYPLYNGSIGMTYEQGGGPRGGLGALKADGDTLTLYDRAIHHFTTSLSTIEVASDNASKLLTEFQNYYNDATTKGVGDYKSYVVKTSARDAAKIDGLTQLLSKNNIRFYTGKAANIRGYNYDSGKEESFSVSEGDLIVPSVQPKSALIKVLFEPKATLVDTVTYDITAWSLPYVYGVKTYASKQTIAKTGAYVQTKMVNPSADNTYGYVIPWNSIQSAKLAAQLTQKGIRLRYAEEPFESGGKTFDRGSMLVLKTANNGINDLWNTVRELAGNNQVGLVPVSSGMVDKGYDFGSSRVHPIKQRKVALLTGEGVDPNAAGEVWFFFDQELNYPITLINASDFARTDWREYDVLILPNGVYRLLNDKTAAEQLHNWVAQGGNLIALEGATAQLSKLDWINMKVKKADDSTDSKNVYDALRKYENRERDAIPNITPGSIFRVELDNTHPLAFGYPDYYYTLKQDDTIYDFVKEGGWNVGVIKKENQVSGFVGSKLQKHLQDGLLFGVQEQGRGNVIFLTDDVLFRNFWQNGKLLFYNAVFLVGQ